MKKIIVAITGASGAIYARQCVEMLLKDSSIEEIAVVISDYGRQVMEHEHVQIPTDDLRIVMYDNEDMFAPIASGSAGYDAMTVVPCSMAAVGRIASGVSSDLISRAADVMLKERKRLIVVVRETPLSTIHLRNMTTISECGAVVMPASPSFYSGAESKHDLCKTVSERIIASMGIKQEHFTWGRDN